MGPVLLCARLGGMAVSAHRTQTRSVSAYRRPECLLKSRMCERHLSGSERAWAATFGEHPVYSTCAVFRGSLLPHPPLRQGHVRTTQDRLKILDFTSRSVPNGALISPVCCLPTSKKQSFLRCLSLAAF